MSWQFAPVWRDSVASPLTVSEVRWVLLDLADLTLCRSIQLLVLGARGDAAKDLAVLVLSNQWTVADFYPIDYIPTGVRLTAYGGDAADLPTDVLQAYLDAVAAGRLTVPIDRTYTLHQIAQAHTDMEHGRATGKLVVLP